MRHAVLVLAVLSAACSGTTESPPAIPVSPITETLPADLPAILSDAPLVYEADLDLGGEALEPLRVHRDGVIVLGTARARLDAEFPPQLDENLVGTPAPGHLVIGIPQRGDEDPPRRWIVLRRDANALTVVLDQVLPNQYIDGLALEIDGDMVSVRETYNMTCGRYWAPRNYEGMGDDMEVAVPVEVERLVFRDNAELRRDASGEEIDCRGGLAACPFVYLVEDGEEQLMGEVLRNVRGEDAYTSQGLAVSGNTAGEVTVIVREEKPEVTYLDHVTLVVGGVAIAPLECATTPAPAFCEADHVPHQLAPGEELRLTFRSSPGARELVATGYYIPIPSR